MSYQYCFYLYYCKIHLCMFICCYYTLIYDKLVIFIMFNFKPSMNCFPHKFRICSFVIFFKHSSLLQTNKSTTFPFSNIHNVLKPLKNGALWGLDDCCEGYRDSDINRLDSVNLRQYTTVPNQCEQLPWTRTWRPLYLDY